MLRRSQRIRGVTRAAMRLVALLAAIAMVVGVLRANARYFYCPFSGAIAERSCCAAEESPAGLDAESPSAAPVDCCEAKRIGALPSGAVAPAPDVPTAPLLALVPAVTAALAVPVARRVPATRDALHTGPPTPGAARARTMVFLI